MDKQAVLEQLRPFFLEHHEFSIHRKRVFSQAFVAFARYTADPFNMTREQFIEAYNCLEADYKPQSWNGYVSAVRSWYKWRSGGESYPDAVRKVKMKKINRLDYIKTKIITDSEIAAMLRVADHPRDRALVAFYRGTGARLGEGLSIRIRDVHDLAGKGFEFTVSGKTGTYITPPVVGGYAAIIREWLNFHPYRDVPDAPLWLHSRGNRFVGLKKNRVYAIITRLAKEAGIKRTIHPHMFRHTQASEDARNKIPLSTRRKRHGWSADSSMPNVYEHLSDEDGTAIYLESFGLEKEKKRESDLFGVAKCLVCGEENSKVSKFCCRCGTVLDEAEAKRQLERQRLIDYLVKLHMDELEKKKDSL